jgi:rhomboid protease GluP
METDITKTGDAKKKLSIRFNSPVILIFALAATIILALSYIIPGLMNLFTVPGNTYPFNWFSLDLFRLVSHALGHENWQHLLGNFTFILLLGPILEEKYGSGLLLLFMLVTAFVTGVLNVILFPSGLLGASGIVFMCILLTSFTNVRKGEIPITFIIVTLIFLGQEVFRAFQQNNISEFAHLIGGLCGGAFGFLFSGMKEKDKSIEDTISGPGPKPPVSGF